MTELELRLTALSEVVEFPPTPDLGPRVRARIAKSGATPGRGPALQWRLAPRVAVAGVFAALVLGLGLTMAVSPTARSAILRWLGIEGVRITRVQHLPPTRAGAVLALGERVPAAEARRRARFAVAVPPALGSPDEWHFERSIPGGAVSLVYNAGPGRPRAGPSGVSILLTEFRGDVGPFIKKMLGPGTRIRNVTVHGTPAYLITGTLHAVIFQDARGEIREDRPRLATNTLLFEREGVTFRLEGDFAAARLLAIANSVR
jgi:hypothetical protein